MARAKKATIVEVELTATEKIAAMKAEIKQMQTEQKAAEAAKKLERLTRRKELMQNGEMPPNPERPGPCLDVWSFCFAYREENGVTPSSKLVREALPELNTHTVSTQTSRFRKYVGDIGRSLEPSNNPFAKTEEAE